MARRRKPAWRIDKAQRGKRWRSPKLGIPNASRKENWVYERWADNFRRAMGR